MTHLRTTQTANVNADLQAERDRCTFDPEAFAEWWHNGVSELRVKRQKDAFVLDIAELSDQPPVAHLSHKQRYEQTVRNGTLVMTQIRRLLNAPPYDQHATVAPRYLPLMYAAMSQFTGMLAAGPMADGNPLGVHFGMFLPTIMGLGTEQQQHEWLMRSWRMEIIGTYVQTELGHGTFLRGLQTTATFDERTDEFVIRTPSLNATKWWPGGLGHTCNFAVVMAQLIVGGRAHGLHAFIVQLRDSDSWLPMAGIRIGEVGPKLGFNGVNNGFVAFDAVRIDRSAMLARNAHVRRDGTFVRTPAPAVLTYRTMIFVRVSLPRDMANYVSRAATIATRYSAVRRQSPIDPDRPEPQIIEHRLQQRKLLGNTATALAFKLTADRVWSRFLAIADEMDAGEMRGLAELHALACCVKAVTTCDAAACVEELRQACGGHGYMLASGLPAIYGSVAAACTYDGEQTVMLLQTGRFLVKCWKRVGGDDEAQNDDPSETLAYMRRSVAWPEDDDPSLDDIVGALETVAASRIRLACEHIERRLADEGTTREQATNATSIQLAQAAEAHARAYIVRTAVDECNRLRAQSVGDRERRVYAVIGQLIELYARQTAQMLQADLLRHCRMTDEPVRANRERIGTLLSALRPNAVGIVDGFDWGDIVLDSALGAYDGRVYERLFDEAQKSPLNEEGAMDVFRSHVKPLLRAHL